MSSKYYENIEKKNKELGIQCPKCESFSVQVPGLGDLFCYDCGEFFTHENDPRYKRKSGD